MDATDTFRKAPWRHNCAQAIANRWRHLYDQEDIVGKYASLVGGHAPDGYCGALYAAMQACHASAEKIRREFIEIVGDDHCSRIKLKGCTPCDKCVATADRLVEKFQ